MSESTPRAVFLSYAREDADAARRIAEALRSASLEVWFDENELRGGDSWDAKIRKQINDCTLFIPVISAHTQERGKGYFRLEWRLAVEQTHLMAEGMAFLAPIVVDDTRETGAVVPPEFLKVQWTRLPGALPTPQFVAQVQRLLEAPPKTGGSVSRPAGGGAQPPTLTKKSGIPGWTAGTVVAVAVGVGTALFLTLKPKPVGPVSDRPHVESPAVAQSPSLPPATPPAAAGKSVAVLAFADLSEGRNSEYLSDGISEELLNVLAKIPNLRVAARTSAFFFKGRNEPIPEIGEKLNVAYVVEGSVQRAGDRVKITAQLIKAADGYHVWSDTFTRELKDVFAVEEEIAGLIAKNLSLKLGMTTGAAAPTKNPAAYEIYLRARAAQMKLNADRADEAIRLYEEALRLDPDFALAWARLAQLCANIFFGGFDRGDELAVKARAAAVAALRLNPDLPEAHLAQARIYQALDNDLAGAGRELDEMVRLRAGDAEVPALRADLAYAGGQTGDALATLIARAVDADPQNGIMLLSMADRLRSIGRYAEADRLIDRATRAGAEVPQSIRQKVQVRAAWTGDLREALDLLETMPETARTHTRFHVQRAELREQQGEFAAAIADFELFREIRSDKWDRANRTGPRYVMMMALYEIARIKARQGKTAEAARLLDAALAEGEQFVREFAHARSVHAFFALVRARRGENEQALAEAAENLVAARNSGYVPDVLSARLYQAYVLAGIGRADEAVAELRAVAEAGYAFGYTLRTNPELESLRGNAQFQQLVKEAEARADAQPRPK